MESIGNVNVGSARHVLRVARYGTVDKPVQKLLLWYGKFDFVFVGYVTLPSLMTLGHNFKPQS